MAHLFPVWPGVLPRAWRALTLCWRVRMRGQVDRHDDVLKREWCSGRLAAQIVIGIGSLGCGGAAAWARRRSRDDHGRYPLYGGRHRHDDRGRSRRAGIDVALLTRRVLTMVGRREHSVFGDGRESVRGSAPETMLQCCVRISPVPGRNASARHCSSGSTSPGCGRGRCPPS